MYGILTEYLVKAKQGHCQSSGAAISQAWLNYDSSDLYSLHSQMTAQDTWDDEASFV